MDASRHIAFDLFVFDNVHRRPLSKLGRLQGVSMATRKIDFPTDHRKWTILHKVVKHYPKAGQNILEMLEDYAKGGVIRQCFTDTEIIQFLFKTYPQIQNVSKFKGWQSLLKKVRNGEISFSSNASQRKKQNQKAK